MIVNVDTNDVAKIGENSWESFAIVSNVKRALSRASLTLHSVIIRPSVEIAAQRTPLKICIQLLHNVKWRILISHESDTHQSKKRVVSMGFLESMLLNKEIFRIYVVNNIYVVK